MNRRRFAFTAAAAVCALTIAGVSAGHPREMAASLPQLKRVVLEVTGYDSASVEVTAGTYMLTVTVINSRLANSPSRDQEAHKIADALTRTIAATPELATIQALHVDYVSRVGDRDDWRIVDGVDFWKDPQGNFRLHTT